MIADPLIEDKERFRAIFASQLRAALEGVRWRNVGSNSNYVFGNGIVTNPVAGTSVVVSGTGIVGRSKEHFGTIYAVGPAQAAARAAADRNSPLSEAQEFLRTTIDEAVNQIFSTVNNCQFVFDPVVAHIAEIVERTLPDARREVSEANIERIVEVLVETQDPLAATNARIDAANAKARHRFVESFPTFTAEEVNSYAGSKAKNQHQTASRWKAERKIFSIPFQQKERFPAFQFKDGRPIKVIADVLAELPGDMSPWEIAFWFVSTNGWLDDEAPVDCLKQANKVIEAARLEREDVVG